MNEEQKNKKENYFKEKTNTILEEEVIITKEKEVNRL